MSERLVSEVRKMRLKIPIPGRVCVEGGRLFFLVSLKKLNYIFDNFWKKSDQK
jgi:hypothetical protein